MENIRDIGSGFEQYMVEYFGMRGYWVHFFAHADDGSQPADLIIAKCGKTYLIDCKTVANGSVFPLSRIEQNQELAANRWTACGNYDERYVFAIRNANKVYFVGYDFICSIKAMGETRFPFGIHPTSWEDYLNETVHR